MNVAIILAGGTGSRMGVVDRPKQFLDVYGKPLIIHTLEVFNIHKNIDTIVISCNKEWINELNIWIRQYDLDKVKYIVQGGETRQESTFNALKSLEGICKSDDIVLIHDAARPLVSTRIIDDNLKLMKESIAVDTVIPATDTIVKSKDGVEITDIPKRKELYLGQTPQSFKFSEIVHAHKKAIEDGFYDSTDDCQLLLRLNKNVRLVRGDKMNFKITTFDDYTLFKAVLKMGKTEVKSFV